MARSDDLDRGTGPDGPAVAAGASARRALAAGALREAGYLVREQVARPVGRDG